jgi:Na+/proline symporter
LLAYLGGFSAATGMVIVATVALATMVSNDLVLPALWRWRPPALGDRSLASGGILWIRRAAILAILLVAFGFFRVVPNGSSLASIGLLAFAAVAQFAPAVISAVYWSGASRVGVLAGLCGGFLVWIYTLLLPSFAYVEDVTASWITEGPFGIAVLAPHSLLGFAGPDPLTHGVFWSLLINIGLLVGMSLHSPPAIGERLQLAPRIAGANARRASCCLAQQRSPTCSSWPSACWVPARLKHGSSTTHVSKARITRPRSERMLDCYKAWNASWPVRWVQPRRAWY